MILIDVNVLIYALRKDAKDHVAYRKWLEEAINSDEPYGLTSVVLTGFLRVITHPRVYKPPTPVDTAWAFVDMLLAVPNCVPIAPGARHWHIFKHLCEESEVVGPLFSDAYLAAMAIENGAELITTDRDFARFVGLRWRHPLR